MTLNNVAKLSCKVLGLYILINGITGVSSIVYIPQGTPNILRMIFPSIVQIILGIVLWLLTESITNLMITNDNEVEPVSNSLAGNGQRVAFSVLGLFFTATSLPKLVSSIIIILITPPQVQLSQPSTIYRTLIEAIVQLIVGLIILLGSSGLVGLLNTFRNAGLSKDKIE